MSTPIVVHFGPEICGTYGSATEREWLVTNGLGGFACGTVAGIQTRRYHGMLIASLPEIGRTLVFSRVEETLRYAGDEYALSANRWASGTVEPEGFRYIEKFYLAGSIPVWRFRCADAVLEKRVWMQDGANTTFIRYDLIYGSAPAELEVKILVNYRGIHGTTRGAEWKASVTAVPRGLCVAAREGAAPVYLLSDAFEPEARQEWYRDYDLPEERERGLDDREDHLLAGIFRTHLSPGGSATIALSTEAAPALTGRAGLAAREALDQRLLENWIAAHPRASLEAPHWIWQFVLAAAQFPVRRRGADGREKWSIIAGYPWFGEWGRDAMIALPGLALETGRIDIARSMLSEFPGFIQQGLLPNTFSESGEPGSYNSVDAMLWYIHALQQYALQTADLSVAREVFDLLAAAVDCYARGTRYGIHADPADGLLYAGEPGMQVTWMDAKLGDRVFTPRIGKPVEVNALWFNALQAMARFAAELGKAGGRVCATGRAGEDEFLALLECGEGLLLRRDRCAWGARGPGGPAGNDASLRPNQIFAVSLPESPLSVAQSKSVVDICARRLADAARVTQPRPCRCKILRPLRRFAGGTRWRLPPGHRLGLVAGPFCAGALARLRRRGEGLRVSGTDGTPPLRRRLGQR